MTFSTRNAYYLRASNYRVIPLFLYLDERHVDWMSDFVLQRVIAEIQPKMSELLFAARMVKKHKVHVERGEGYQYCYFLRTTTRTEVVLLKQKEFSLRAPTPPPAPEHVLARKRRGRTRSVSVREETPLVEVGAEEEVVKTRESAVPTEMDERDIKDWKPDTELTYKGFGTSSLQFVLIVEPYPPLAPSQYAPPSSRLSSRSTSIASTARSRSKAGTGRYSSTSLSVSLDHPSNLRNASLSAVPNSRNASLSAVPNSRRGGTSTPAREDSATPGPGASSRTRRRMSETPLFLPADEEDEEAHEEYEEALREGRRRLPSVMVGEEDDVEMDDDEPDGMRKIGERLVRSSQLEEGVVRVSAGWEEREEGEESAVMGREEPGE
ncbi:hypothetical protein P7C73_g4657, partial [Tremellales sp. Uapishka_1]